MSPFPRRLLPYAVLGCSGVLSASLGSAFSPSTKGIAIFIIGIGMGEMLLADQQMKEMHSTMILFFGLCLYCVSSLQAAL